MLNPKFLDLGNPDQRKAAIDFVSELADSFYRSSVYTGQYDRYQKHLKAYHLQHEAKAPSWRSKIFLATYFTAVKTLDAQFKSSHQQDPFVWVKLAQDSIAEPGAQESAMKAHADLQYDLEISRFKNKLDQAYWYVEGAGTVVGREYFRAYDKTSDKRQRKFDEYGNEIGSETVQQSERVEHTCTDIIHPLNFAHEITKNDIEDCEWVSVRFDMSVSTLYQIAAGADGAEKQEILDLIGELKDNKYKGISNNPQYFYSENVDKFVENHRIVVYEYSGPIYTKYNDGDFTRYYMLYHPDTRRTIKISKSPFSTHPYWKMQTHPSPDGPYGIAPCMPVLQINWWENSNVNQYIDYANMALKFQYEVQAENIEGGIARILQGLPYNLVPLASGKKPGETFAPIRNNTGSISPISDGMNLIERYKQEHGPTSLLRGKSSGNMPAADTATGIQLLSQREDEMIAMLQRDCDTGIERAMQLKIMNSSTFFDQLRSRNINGMQSQYYPYEYGNIGYSFKITRRKPDLEAGKYMSFYKLLGTLAQAGQASGAVVPFDVYVNTAMQVGRAMDIDNVDQILGGLLQTANVQGQAPQIGSSQQGQGQLPDMAQLPEQTVGQNQPNMLAAVA